MTIRSILQVFHALLCPQGMGVPKLEIKESLDRKLKKLKKKYKEMLILIDRKVQTILD